MTTRLSRTANIVEDAEWLFDSGESVLGACERLGVKPKTLKSYYQRTGVFFRFEYSQSEGIWYRRARQDRSA